MTVVRARLRRSALGLLVLALLVPLCTGAASAQQPTEEGEGGEADAPRPRQAEERSAADERPALARARAARREGTLEIDGELSEEAWARAPAATGFVQREPVEGAEPTEPTEVRVLYDDEAFYVGALMHESDPTSIRDQMVRRDGRGQFDFFAVTLDPNLDRQTGYHFQVSAAGVQTDQLLFNDTDRDRAWDAVWDSDVARTDRGWSVEMRIPLSQIQFEPADSVQTWGVNFFRRRLASNERLHFSLISRLQEGRVSQAGRLRGIEIAEGAGGVELIPFVSGSGRLGHSEPGNPFFDGSSFDQNVGGELSLGIAGNFQLDATFNPDFGQIRPDRAVTNLTAFETFFEERRPFFIENVQLFDFPLSGRDAQLLFTRRIGREPQGGPPSGAEFSDIPGRTTILGAAKLTGRTADGLSVGALAAVAQEETGTAFFPERGEFTDFVAEPRSQYGALSLQQDFNDGDSQVEMLLSGMRRDLVEEATHGPLPSSAFNGGVRFEHRWNDREWALTGYLSGTHVRGDTAAILRIQRNPNHYFQRPDARFVELDPDRTSLTGADWRLELNRRKGSWTGGVWLAEVTPGFAVNDLGFKTSGERLDGGARIGYRNITPGDIFRSWRVNAFTFHNWSHDVLETGIGSFENWRDAHTNGTFALQSELELLNYWRIDPRLEYSPRNMSRTETRGGPVMVEPASWQARLGVTTDRRKPVNFETRVSYRDRLRDAGSQFQADVRMELRPSDRFEIRLGPSFTKRVDRSQYVTAVDSVPFAPTFGSRYIFGDIDRRTLSLDTRVNYTFTPDLTFQLFAQPFISTGDFERYKQLSEPGTFRFDRFEDGQIETTADGVRCVGGRSCLDEESRTRFLDFEGDGSADASFDVGGRNGDFNFRSLIVSAVVRWEFRPGSRLFVVWQRFQDEQARLGDFDLGRDADALLGAGGQSVFTIKVDYHLGL